jgi:hypothetical protein
VSKNPYGATHSVSMEWGRKARKREDQQRGMSHKADRQAIAEQVADLDGES